MSTPSLPPLLPSTSRLRHDFVTGRAFSSASRNGKAAAALLGVFSELSHER
jgi:hypothetical protein